MKCKRWCISHHEVMDDGHKEGTDGRRRDGGGGGSFKGLIKKRTHLKNLIQFCSSQHVLICANQVAGAVADARGPHGLAQPSGKLKY